MGVTLSSFIFFVVKVRWFTLPKSAFAVIRVSACLVGYTSLSGRWSIDARKHRISKQMGIHLQPSQTFAACDRNVHSRNLVYSLAERPSSKERFGQTFRDFDHRRR